MNTNIAKNIIRTFEKRYKGFGKIELADEEIEMARSVKELFVLILIKGVENINKRGMYTTYVDRNEQELSSPRGKINIEKTISKMSMQKGKIVCDYQEYTIDNRLNKVIKCEVLKIQNDKDINEDVKSYVRKRINLLNGIDVTDSYIDRIIGGVSGIARVARTMGNGTRNYKPVIRIIIELENGRKKHSIYKSINISDSEVKSYAICQHLIYEIANDVAERDSCKRRGNTIETYEKYDNGDVDNKRVSAYIGEKYAIIFDTCIYEEDSREKFMKKQMRNLELAREALDIQQEYGVKCAVATMNLCGDDKLLLIRDKDTIVVNDIVICNEYIDLKDNYNIIENKVVSVYKQFMK